MGTKNTAIGKKVLVVMSEARVRRTAIRSIAATGAICSQSSNAKDASQQMRETSFDLVVVDWQNAADIEDPTGASKAAQIVLLTNRPVFERHSQDIGVFPLTGVIVNSFVAMKDSYDAVSTRELVTTVAKLFTRDILGLEKYLGWGAAVHELSLTNSSESQSVVDNVCKGAAAAGMSERERSNLGLLVDELLMNAIWDAPTDAEGKAKYHSLSRGVPIALEPNETVTIRYGSDGNVFGVSVADRFGRLEQDLAVSYIKKCFRINDQQISQDAGGSGLGLYMAYNSVSSFVVNVQPARCTEVIGLIRLGSKRRPSETESVSRSLCYFRGEETR